MGTHAVMKILRPQTEIDTQGNLSAQLNHFIQQPGSIDSAPCPGCVCDVRSDCSPSCEYAPRALSIEPDRYPIEPHVIAIVFEMMTTGLMKTCWSCEGHMNEKGELWKIPQVCFYSPASIYVKLLHMHITALQQQKMLAYKWQISITDFATTMDVTYCLQPDLNHEASPRLGLLQNDLKLISKDMSAKLKLYAIELLTTLDT